jgi:predicted glutamine amidotransferase
MCRILAYAGPPIAVEDLVVAPAHSIVRQSLDAHEAKTVTNGDGFGIGWYGDHPEPGRYRQIMPAWSDENLISLARHIRARLFFAHVRAATGGGVSIANCHPFAVGRWMFMHNGQIGGHQRIRRLVEALIPDELYGFRQGATDSEAIFLAALGRGLEHDPIEALTSVLADIAALQERAGVTEALRVTACLTDGRVVRAIRWATDGRAPTLYWRPHGDGVVIGSEPADVASEPWIEVPQASALTVEAGRTPVVTPLSLKARVPA